VNPIVRRVLAAILVVGLIGSAVELLLLKHTDGFWQLLPLLLIGAALLGLAWHAAAPSRASLRALQALMAILVVSGIAGVLLHYRGNVEWELERLPGTHGWELFRHAVMGATPALAPGTMLQLGLVGLLFTYRHPVLESAS
jgi:hypothetical protein